VYNLGGPPQWNFAEAGFEEVEQYDFPAPHAWTLDSFIGYLYSTSLLKDARERRTKLTGASVISAVAYMAATTVTKTIMPVCLHIVTSAFTPGPPVPRPPGTRPNTW
jgi:hypothetical protein